MNKSLPNRWFWLILIIPVLILIVLLYKPLMTQYYGEEITLQTEPYDPRDLLYGDYVHLNFQIEVIGKTNSSIVEQNVITKAKKLDWDDQLPVYVSLQPRDQVYVVKHVSETKPTKGIYLQGLLKQHSEGYRIDYGLNQYYVEENTGKELESMSTKGNLHAVLKVRNGHAMITNLKKAK